LYPDGSPAAPDLGEVLRSALHEDFAEASEDELDEALANVLDSMSAAEGFNFASALSRIGKGAGAVLSDPAFAAIARTALPVLGGAAGTMIGGPVGTALGSQLGNLAASALPTRPAPAPAPPAPAVPAPPPPAVSPAPAAPPPPPPPASAVPAAPPAPATAQEPPAAAPAPVPAAAGGSAAAAQGLVLTQQPDVLRGLLATAMGQYGRPTVSGVPVAQVLGLLSQVFGQAAADADELMYHRSPPGAAPAYAPESADEETADTLYADLLGADNLELAEAAGWEGLD
jgi:hypothetical protein